MPLFKLQNKTLEITRVLVHESVKNSIFVEANDRYGNCGFIARKWGECSEEVYLLLFGRMDVAMCAVAETGARCFKAQGKKKHSSYMCIGDRVCGVCMLVCRFWHFLNGKCFCVNGILAKTPYISDLPWLGLAWLLSFKCAFILVYVSTMNSFGDISSLNLNYWCETRTCHVEMYTIQNCYIIKTIIQTMNVTEIIHIIPKVVNPSEFGAFDSIIFSRDQWSMGAFRF